MLRIGLTAFFMTSVICQQLEWWQKTPIYQIYPRSFKDSDGDGIGDLKGITNYMEHFIDAGIRAFWISPIYKSPMIDFGYDIADFRKIDETFGTMEDFEALISKAKSLGIKVILDFVPNHASTESDYFKLSVNKTKGYEDFFIWDDGFDDPSNPGRKLPPCNWISQFLGSAWQWNNERQQFYLHQFSVSQADLNYRNPIVVEEMKSVIRFWLDKGVDGFRIDALPYMFEVEKTNGRYPDDPLSNTPGIEPGQLGYTIPIYSKDRAETYDMVNQWRQLLDEYAAKDGNYRLMMTEAYANKSFTLKYYDAGSDIPFNFNFIDKVNNNSNAVDFVTATKDWLDEMPKGKTANWVLSNHDNPRMASRFGANLVDGLTMYQMMLPGVAVTYQGDEIGMPNGYVSYKDTVDVSGCNAGPDDYEKYSRDPARTPFQWSDEKNAGFSTANKTWLPVGQDYLKLNLKLEKSMKTSTFKLYQKLTYFRSLPALLKGGYELRSLTNYTIGLSRTIENDSSFYFAFNLGKYTDEVSMTSFEGINRHMNVFMTSTNSNRHKGEEVDIRHLKLQPGEALILHKSQN